MAGRGRGRGGPQAKSSINMLASALGIERTEMRNQPVVLPPPLYPDLPTQPQPVLQSKDFMPAEDYSYLVALKQEFISTMQESPYFTSEESSSTTIEVQRYGDRLKRSSKKDWTPNYQRLPKELWPKRLRQADKTQNVPKKVKYAEEVTKKLTMLEQRELKASTAAANSEDVVTTRRASDAESSSDDEKKEKAGAEDAEEVVEDEEDEEFNDYIESYFDPGEEYLDDSEDNPDDAAVY